MISALLYHFFNPRRPLQRTAACCLLLIAALGAAHAQEPRMNQIQVVGTHNSYHIAPDYYAKNAANTSRKDMWGLAYSHAPLNEQLDRGVRSFELDLNYTAEGYQVFHHPLVDTKSTCPLFTDCLNTILLWSQAHPNHVPVSVLLETKSESVPFHRKLMHIDVHALDRLDEDIRAVFAPDKLITPDDLRRDAPTLPDAIAQYGWPELSQARGKVFFILHDKGPIRETYLDGHPALQGRAMFVESNEHAPHAAVFIRNEPQNPQIPELTRAGFLVRTRADSGLTGEVRNGPQRRETAFASGAHIISTDFPPGQPCPETGYVVQLPGGAGARYNPVNGPIEGAPIVPEIEPMNKTADARSSQTPLDKQAGARPVDMPHK